MAKKLKDIFFQESFFVSLKREIKKVHTKFDTEKFSELIYSGDWEKKSLKERMEHTAAVLKETLPADYRKALNVLIKIEHKFGNFEHLTFADYVRLYGLDNYDASIKALEIFTKSSAEFAIRPFIKRYPEKTMQQMHKWAKSEKDYVRRLASEGCRPRLPWGESLPSLKKDPGPILPILEILKNDKSETVRRSVANNLNDISKDNPEIVLGIAEKWKGKSDNIDRLVKHALRTLLKQGNPRALKLFGFGNVSEVYIKGLKLSSNKIPIGDNVTFRFVVQIKGKKALKLRLEYILDYMKAKGKRSRKVFQIQEKEFGPGESKFYERKLDFKEITTRKYYPGKHILTVVLNGVEKESIEFALV